MMNREKNIIGSPYYFFIHFSERNCDIVIVIDFEITIVSYCICVWCHGGDSRNSLFWYGCLQRIFLQLVKIGDYAKLWCQFLFRCFCIAIQEKKPNHHSFYMMWKVLEYHKNIRPQSSDVPAPLTAEKAPQFHVEISRFANFSEGWSSPDADVEKINHSSGILKDIYNTFSLSRFTLERFYYSRASSDIESEVEIHELLAVIWSVLTSWELMIVMVAW